MLVDAEPLGSVQLPRLGRFDQSRRPAPTTRFREVEQCSPR